MTIIQKICAVPNCTYKYTQQSARRGYCYAHYLQILPTLSKVTDEQRKRNRPALIKDGAAFISLGFDAKDGYTLVDAEDAHLADIYKLCLSATGYAVTSVDKIKLHRIIIGAKDGEYCDHINGDRLDNRKANLRIVTHQQNMMNVRPRSSNGYKGVSRMSQSRITENTRKIWRAYIKPNGKQISLGLHETPEQAAKAYDKAAKEYFGEYAYLNFPDA